MTLDITQLFKVIVFCISISFILIIIEYFYSAYKKDNKHRLHGTISNTLNGVFMKMVLSIFVSIYFGHQISLYLSLGYNNVGSSVNLISFLLCLLIVDLSYYLYHIAHHRIRLLWAIHSVHHGDDKFNTSTAYRLSWFEKIYNITIFIPAILIGFNPHLAALCFAIMSVYDFFCHNAYIKFPKIFEYILVTPQTHIIHHDQEITHQNSNYGAMFCIWDRIFGTYVEKIGTIELGIKGYKEDGFIKMQLDPLMQYFKSMKRNA